MVCTLAWDIYFNPRFFLIVSLPLMKQNLTNLKGIILFAALFLCVFIADITGVYLYYQHVEKFIHNQPTAIKADAGIIFFGDYLKEGRELGPDSKKRATEAIDLFNSGKIKAIVCVGGYDYSIWKGKPHLMSEFLINHGIPPGKIFHDSLSFNTITNCREALNIIKQNHFDTIVAISSPLHIFRIASSLKYNHAWFASYDYAFNHLSDYWVIYRDVHNEWLSQFLSFAIRDDLRNQIVYIYQTVKRAIKNII